MKIRDLSKVDKDGNPLEIVSDSFTVRRYVNVGGKYYDSDDSVVHESSAVTSGTIFQNDGVIELEDTKENSTVDFDPITQGENNVNLGEMITSNMGGYASNQDKNTDDFTNLDSIGENTLEALKYAGLSATNIGGIGTEVDKIVKGATDQPTQSAFDIANQKVVAWKEKAYKQIHINDFKESQYYNDVSNLANTQNKYKRGSLGYSSDITDIAQNLLAKLGDNDYQESAEELMDLNFAGEYNMYSDKPGAVVKSKPLDSGKEYPTTKVYKEISNYRDSENKYDNRVFALQNDHEIQEFNIGKGIDNRPENPFSPRKLSDAQARMISILKYKNTFLTELGCLYVKPWYNSDGLKNFYVPFEFKPEISEGNMAAKYQAENLLNRLGSMMVYTGTELSTLTLSTTYIALAPDFPEQDELSRQHNVNAWEFNWTNNRLEEIEYKLRSLVFPDLLNGTNGSILKPPIVQILIGGEKENPNVGTLYKYPSDDAKYFKITSSDDRRIWKKYVVTSVQIDNLNDVMSYPSLYVYTPNKRLGFENDGISANVTTALTVSSESNINYTTTNGVKSADEGSSTETKTTEGNYIVRRRGFKVTLQLAEVTENFLDIVPDFKAYYDAFTNLETNANLTKTYANENMYNNLRNAKDVLTAEADTLFANTGTLEERIKELLEKAYVIAKNYYEPDEAILTSLKTILKLTGADDTEYKSKYPNWDNIKTNVKFAKINNIGSEKGRTSIYVYNNEYRSGASKQDTTITHSFCKKPNNGKDYNFEGIFYDCPFKVNLSESLDLNNKNLLTYLFHYFKNYSELKKLLENNDNNEIPSTRVEKYIKELIKAFEKGGKIFVYNERGSWVNICEVPSVKSIVQMLNNSLNALNNNYNSLENKIKNIALKYTTQKDEDRPPKSFTIDENLHLKTDKDSDIYLADAIDSSCKWTEPMITYLNSERWIYPFSNYYSKNNLKDSYEKIIMKAKDDWPTTNTLNIFNTNYKENDTFLPCEKFISWEYDGNKDKEIAGISTIRETDENKLGTQYDQQYSVARLAVKMKNAKDSYDKIKLGTGYGKETDPDKNGKSEYKSKYTEVIRE